MRSTVKSKKETKAKKTADSKRTNENILLGFDLFDSLKDMYYLLDTNGDIIKLNKRAEEIIKTNSFLIFRMT